MLLISEGPYVLLRPRPHGYVFIWKRKHFVVFSCPVHTKTMKTMYRFQWKRKLLKTLSRVERFENATVSVSCGRVQINGNANFWKRSQYRRRVDGSIHWKRKLLKTHPYGRGLWWSDSCLFKKVTLPLFPPSFFTQCFTFTLASWVTANIVFLVDTYILIDYETFKWTLLNVIYNHSLTHSPTPHVDACHQAFVKSMSFSKTQWCYLN